MGEYAAIEKEAKLFTELCVHNDAIDPNLFDEFGVKRGLRDVNGKGVLAGLTNISDIIAQREVDGILQPCPGELYYRGIRIEELVQGFAEKRVRTGSKPRCLIPARRPRSGPARWAWQCTDLPGRRPRWAAC